MYKKFFLILISVCFVQNGFSQLDAEIGFNSTSFCGENSLLEMQDITVGAVVTRAWSITGPTGFSPISGNGVVQAALLTEVGFYAINLTVCDATMTCNTQTFSNLVEVKAKPDLSISASNYCVDKANVFTATVTPAITISNYFWDFDDGFGFVPGANPATKNFSNTGSNTIALHVEAANGCRDTTTTTINVLDKPNAEITATDTFVCVGNSVSFSGLNSTTNTSGLSYAWDIDYNTGIDNTNSSFTILANDSRLIMLIVEDANTCVDTAFKGLNIVQVPEVVFNISPQCATVSFELEANVLDDGGSPIDSVYWLIDGSINLNGNTVNYTHNVKDSIPIIVFVSNEEGCIDGSQQFVTIDAFPEVTLDINDTIICAGEAIQIKASGDANYIWSQDSSTIDSITVNPTENTVYTVYGSSASGACPVSETNVLVEVLQEPTYIIDASATNPGLGTPVFLDISYEPQFSNNDSIKWLDSGTSNELAFEYGTENNFIASESVSLPIELKYTKDATTCVFDTTIRIEVNENCATENIFVPNVFTPNNDGKNDFFIIKGFSIAVLEHFVVYNRGGQEVFSAQNIEFDNGIANSGWNGTNKNDVYTNTGVYVYYYKAKCINGLETEGSGNISLFR